MSTQLTTQLTYTIIKTVGKETIKGNAAFDQLEHLVNEHIRKGWPPVVVIAVSSVVDPKTVGLTRINWFVRVA